MIRELVNRSLKTTLFFGKPADDKNNDDSKYKFSFAADPVGLIVVSNEMELLTQKGTIGIDEVEVLNEKWWGYWKEYWKRRDTENPMPRDYTCEVTIPTKGSLD